MYAGKVMEAADTKTIFRNPKHAYTEALLAAVPSVDRRGTGNRSSRNTCQIILQPAITREISSDVKGRATFVLRKGRDFRAPWAFWPPVVNEMLGQNETGLVIFTRAPKSSMYSLRITSWNSTYLVRLQSVWSAYFKFRYGVAVGAALIPASLLLIYYDRVVEKREKMFQETLDKATGKSRSSN